MRSCFPRPTHDTSTLALSLTTTTRHHPLLRPLFSLTTNRSRMFAELFSVARNCQRTHENYSPEHRLFPYREKITKKNRKTGRRSNPKPRTNHQTQVLNHLIVIVSKSLSFQRFRSGANERKLFLNALPCCFCPLRQQQRHQRQHGRRITAVS